MPRDGTIKTFRNNGDDKAAVVFLHGFGGDAAATWLEFPNVLGADRTLREWSIFSIGYPSRLRLDWRGIWSADPPLITISDKLRTQLRAAPLERYKAIALIAHSMGGLVVQRAILDAP